MCYRNQPRTTQCSWGRVGGVFLNFIVCVVLCSHVPKLWQGIYKYENSSERFSKRCPDKGAAGMRDRDSEKNSCYMASSFFSIHYYITLSQHFSIHLLHTEMVQGVGG